VLKIVARRPINRRMTEAIADVSIGSDTRVPPVSICKRVNFRQTVMKACTGFEWRVGFMLCPMAGVPEQHPQLHRDLVWIDPNILPGPAKLPSPFLDVTEEMTMEVQHKLLSQ
jgi:hypothetical protein